MTFLKKKILSEPYYEQEPRKILNGGTNQEYVVEHERPPPQEQVVSETEDINKWELETSPMINGIYHELIGEIHNAETGEWVRDRSRKRTMNEIGASELCSELSFRININMQFSDLPEDWIRITSARAGKIFADKLADSWREWEINPKSAVLESIAQRLHDTTFICLNIAKDQGMRKHRERRGVSRIFTSQPEGVL